VTLPIEAMGFHVGMIVHDADAVAERYRRLLGGVFETWELAKSAPAAVDRGYEDSRLRVSYGRYAGMTIEIIQVLSGRGHYARWLERHGEGVQHLGFWVPDLADATRGALEQGAQLRSAKLDPDSLGSVTVSGLGPAQIAAAVLPGSVHVDYGVQAVELEFLGPSSVDTLAAVFGEDLEIVVDLPPWIRQSRR
jgi:Glyoxalase/Bleomycin resistance protein/Dioxygenase superfamily